MAITVLGVICIILGILAMLAPGFTGLSIMLFLGVLLLIGGIVRIIWAFKAHSLGKWLLKLLIGGLTLICGILLINRPILASGVITIILTAYFLLDGIVELIAGIKVGVGSGGGWLLFGGIISILLAIILWKQFPISGIWILGILLGIKLFFMGLIMVAAGSALRLKT
ncbi:MAG: DUF308 domain-containing protein [Candidatus Omnitrophica bacterium]|nr:DUF308 domain-containing protein [Candidatus Omnitrophota bacterium]